MKRYKLRLFKWLHSASAKVERWLAAKAKIDTIEITEWEDVYSAAFRRELQDAWDRASRRP